MPRLGWGRRCEFCGKKVSTPCETQSNADSCANMRNKQNYSISELLTSIEDLFILL